MLSVIICAKEPAQTTLLAKLIQLWADQRALSVQVLSYPNVENFLSSCTEHPFGDILLLDIRLAQTNNIELVRKIRENNRQVQIILCADRPGPTDAGDGVGALYYLIRPIQDIKLFQLLDRAALNLHRTPKDVLLPLNGRPVRIPTADILYAEACSHNVRLHLSHGEESMRMRMSDLEELLDGGFYRCHRSYIVSLEHIGQLSRTAVLLDNGQQIPLARGAYDGLKQAITQAQ